MFRKIVCWNLIFVFCMFFVSRVSAAGIVPDIKANGSGSSIDIVTRDNLTVAVSLTAGSRSGENADWWVVVDTSFGWYHFDAVSNSWTPGLIVTHQGPLFDLPEFEVLNVSGLPGGMYKFYFGIDTNKNGTVDFDQLSFDGVVVNINTAEIIGTYNGMATASNTNCTGSSAPFCKDRDFNGDFTTPIIVEILSQSGKSFTGKTTTRLVIEESVFYGEERLSGTVEEDGTISGTIEGGFRCSLYVGEFNGKITNNNLTYNFSTEDTWGETCLTTGSVSANR